MAKHSTIYPSSQELEAVQTLVSTVEGALKHVSDWLDQSGGDAHSSFDSQAESSTEEDDPGEEEPVQQTDPGQYARVGPPPCSSHLLQLHQAFCNLPETAAAVAAAAAVCCVV